MGCELVVETVAREERDVGVLVGEDGDRGRGLAPGRDWGDCGDGGEALEVAEAGAADDGDVDRL